VYAWKTAAYQQTLYIHKSNMSGFHWELSVIVCCDMLAGPCIVMPLQSSADIHAHSEQIVRADSSECLSGFCVLTWSRYWPHLNIDFSTVHLCLCIERGRGLWTY